MDKLERESLLKSIEKCIKENRIDDNVSENRFLLVQVDRPASTPHALYQDHASTEPEIVVKALERAPRAQGPIFGSLPPFDRGAIFDTKTKAILAYQFKAL